jgi:hypothetical protein
MVLKTEIILEGKTASEVINLVHSLREQGLVQGKDFDFKYQQRRWSYILDEPDIPEHAVFTFYGNNKWATWFKLKWS